MGYAYEKVWDPLSSEGLARLNGRGIFLARTFFDSVTYTGRGNRVDMMKDLAAEAENNAASGAVNGSLT
jgi:anti-sigma regulatory factor (Ser/Thr protein kinase)